MPRASDSWSAPLVSVVIPVYNRPFFVSKCLDSLIRQEYTNWEALVVDDGSTDNTMETLQEYSKRDGRIKVFRRARQPKGAPTCRNIGLQEAAGAFLMFMDSDDELPPFSLATRISEFEKHPECDFLAFNTLLFRQIPGDIDLIWNIDTESPDLLRFIRHDPVWSIGGVIIRTSYLKSRSLYFREEYRRLQDVDFSIRLLSLSPVYLKLLHLHPNYFARRHFQESISHGPDKSHDDGSSMDKYFWNIHGYLVGNRYPIERIQRIAHLIRLSKFYFLRKEIRESYNVLKKLLEKKEILIFEIGYYLMVFSLDLILARINKFLSVKIFNPIYGFKAKINQPFLVHVRHIGRLRYSDYYDSGLLSIVV